MAFNRAETNETRGAEEASAVEGIVRCVCCSRPLRVTFIRSAYGWHGEVVCTGCDRSEPHCNCFWGIAKPWTSRIP